MLVPLLTSISISFILNRMRTTLDLPEELVEEARQLLGFKSKSDTIIVSLRELIRHKRIDELKKMAGYIKLDIDVETSRRRKQIK